MRPLGNNVDCPVLILILQQFTSNWLIDNEHFFPVLIVRHQLVKTGLSESQSKRMLSSHSEGTNTSELFQNLNLSLSRPSTA